MTLGTGMGDQQFQVTTSVGFDYGKQIPGYPQPGYSTTVSEKFSTANGSTTASFSATYTVAPDTSEVEGGGSGLDLSRVRVPSWVPPAMIGTAGAAAVADMVIALLALA